MSETPDMFADSDGDGDVVEMEDVPDEEDPPPPATSYTSSTLGGDRVGVRINKRKFDGGEADGDGDDEDSEPDQEYTSIPVHQVMGMHFFIYCYKVFKCCFLSVIKLANCLLTQDGLTNPKYIAYPVTKLDDFLMQKCSHEGAWSPWTESTGSLPGHTSVRKSAPRNTSSRSWTNCASPCGTLVGNCPPPSRRKRELGSNSGLLARWMLSPQDRRVKLIGLLYPHNDWNQKSLICLFNHLLNQQRILQIFLDISCRI